MTTDPLEELFGPATEETQPVPARQRLAYEQAERVRTAQLPEQRAVAPGSEPKPRRERGDGDRVATAKPWIIVGLVAVVAIVVSIIVVNLVRGGDDSAAPQPTTPPATTAPTQTPDPTPQPDDEEDSEESEDPDQPPTVDVGETNVMPIDAWGVSSQLSQRFGSTSYMIDADSNLVLTSDLLNSFPESCAAMRQGWGATRLADGTYEVLRPAERCAAAPELYDEVWGLLAAWTQTIK